MKYQFPIPDSFYGHTTKHGFYFLKFQISQLGGRVVATLGSITKNIFFEKQIVFSVFCLAVNY